jgi:peptidoglycan/LPS O-acetylase OafA/YrhL
MRGSSNQIVGLNAVRGLAILLVVFAHGAAQFVPHSAEASLSAGNLGVILFFFLSGFLMDRTYGAVPTLWPYLVRRSFRILPMYWVSIGFILITSTQWTARDGIVNAFFAAPAFHIERMSGVYWTLYIEVLFYAAVPFLYWFGRWARSTTPVVLITAFAVLTATHHTPSSWAPFYLVYCLAGLQIGLWSRGQLSSSQLALSVLIVAAGSSALPVVSPYLGLAPLISAALLLAALRFKRDIPGFGFIGKISYSWYLLHMTIGSIVVAALSMQEGLTTCAISAVVSLAISAVTYRLVELPVIEAGKVLIRFGRPTVFATSG